MDSDVIIIGAGPSGLSLARSLSGCGLEVSIIERSEIADLMDPPFDGRDIALTHQARRTLQDLGVWAHLDTDEVAPIRRAKVLDGHSTLPLEIAPEGAEPDTLGWLVSNHLIRRALMKEVQQLDDVEILVNAEVESVATDEDHATVMLGDGRELNCRLLVSADSRFSSTRRAMGIGADMRDFGHSALVCRMEHEFPHRQVAYECFQYGATLAILPLSGNRASIVITGTSQSIANLADMSPEAFAAEVARRSGSVVGDLKLASERIAYPLVAVWARRFVAQRYALIGDAAVGMHPVTAHGFNLGLSGQYLLANGVRRCLAAGIDIADASTLAVYQMDHRRVARPIFTGTNAIVDLFTDDRPTARVVRRAALRLSDRISAIKRMIRDRLMSDEPGPPSMRAWVREIIRPVRRRSGRDRIVTSASTRPSG